MKHARWILSSALLVLIAACAQIDAPDAELTSQATPSFDAALWADGELWATSGVTRIPAPRANNRQSFDALYVITNSNHTEGQLPVAEAAPRNPLFNGGRWFTHTVAWTPAGFEAHDTVPLLTSRDDVLFYEGLGHLTITEGPPPGGPPAYFECPLRPVKNG